jgi:hypothetical protein
MATRTRVTDYDKGRLCTLETGRDFDVHDALGGRKARYWQQHVRVHPEYADLARDMRDLLAVLRVARASGTPIDEATQARIDGHKPSFENEWEHAHRRAERRRSG